jgi:hypothetical protein
VPINYKETPYGFVWGAADVQRYFSDEKKGWITLGLKTQKGNIQIYVTKTGKVRIHDANGEWTKPAKKEK